MCADDGVARNALCVLIMAHVYLSKRDFHTVCYIGVYIYMCELFMRVFANLIKPICAVWWVICIFRMALYMCFFFSNHIHKLVISGIHNKKLKLQPWLIYWLCRFEFYYYWLDWALLCYSLIHIYLILGILAVYVRWFHSKFSLGCCFDVCVSGSGARLCCKTWCWWRIYIYIYSTYIRWMKSRSAYDWSEISVLQSGRWMEISTILNTSPRLIFDYDPGWFNFDLKI